MEKSKKSKIYLMVGIPGSGKSHWIKHHKAFFSGKVKVISRDEIRFSLLEDGDDYFAKETEVWKQYVDQVKVSLTLNDVTILDATHLTGSSRGKILRAVKDYLKGVEVNAIVLDTKIETAIDRNCQRSGRAFVPISAIRRMNSQLTMPTFEEGFENIYICYPETATAPEYIKIISKGDNNE